MAVAEVVAVVEAQIIVFKTFVVEAVFIHFIYVEVVFVNAEFFLIQIVKALIKILLLLIKAFFWFKIIVVVRSGWSGDKRSRSGLSDCECLVLHS